MPAGGLKHVAYGLGAITLNVNGVLWSECSLFRELFSQITAVTNKCT